MPRRSGGLTAAKVTKAKPGRYGDGDGLYLLVRGEKAKSWIARWTQRGRMREIGLGPAIGKGAVSLAEAREKAGDVRRQVRAGIDPIAARKAAKDAEKAEKDAPAAVKFKQAANDYIAVHEKSWRNEKHGQQWRNTIATYCGGDFGEKSVATIDTSDVLGVLQPIWSEKTETASRVRGRIESILDYARVQGWRPDVPNPARWKGHLDHTLPRRSKVQRVKHHAAVPWQELPALVADLRGLEGSTARALELTVLTAARTNEAIGARWPEFDMKERIWRIPADRMKGGREHRVPLTDAALAVLQQMWPLRASDDSYVFPGRRERRPISNMAMAKLLERMGREETVHGFRSSFRDWVGEATAHPREVAEQALAHWVGEGAELAYRRADLLAKRRALMKDWSEYLASKPATVTRLSGREKSAGGPQMPGG